LIYQLSVVGMFYQVNN